VHRELTLTRRLGSLVLNRDANTTIEYALVASGIAMAIAAIASVFGSDLAALFGAIHDHIEAANLR